nr:immunoglobulin heavy chain junction region [Macaca mulatta]MOX14505.1 immunoglobulin heavy chain junction region [Macaca mulatta]MOX14515.1 immunoglobulin heavy chain junction region [Macaca mulatta]MOX14521.1 immunoglobulin heavy chain junction region [Macaca mulatta]MOX14522.1 immunoglobulin heavy chain junction region [Macaca mulatta]
CASRYYSGPYYYDYW